MALIQCPECGKDISDKAVSCPNCGYPLSSDELLKTGDPKFTDEKGTLKRHFVIIGPIVALIAIAVIVTLTVTPRYTGIPEQVAPQVGYVSYGGSGPKVKIAVSLDPSVEEGDELAMMWDLDEEYIVGFARFAEPVSRNYYGDVEIIGDVSSCNGVDEIDLDNATIVD